MIKGSIVAIVTPMKQDGSIDWEAYERLIEFQIENGTNAIVSVGTTGESATLPIDEHIKCVEFCIKVVNGRVPVIAGSGSNDTAHSINTANAVKKAGAAAHLSVAPYYNKPNQRCLLAHFRAIADACELPMILYNVPGRTCSDIAVETVLELSKHPNIIGIKEASTIDRCRELLKVVPKDFAVYSGEDPINCQIISEGAAGAISVTANVAPKLMAQVCNIAQTDFETAKQLDEKLADLHKNLFIEPNPIPVKWALYRMGLIENNLRLPLLPLEENTEIVEKALVKAGIGIN